tara:strand:- start:337 stop:942 length:606 start_codon:yes stop_codon:yes gene_type:complete
MRNQLYDIVFSLKPDWAAVLSQGRTSSMKFLRDNIKQLFIEAKLYDETGSDYNDEAVKWWDLISLAYRNEINQKKILIGRFGERLTMDYEHKRTKKPPQWKSLETDSAGYDVLSIVSKTNTKPLCIEVKTTQNNQPQFFLSRNEFEFMMTRSLDDYRLYLWNINDEKNPQLKILDKNYIVKNAPKDGIGSNWHNSLFIADV